MDAKYLYGIIKIVKYITRYFNVGFQLTELINCQSYFQLFGQRIKILMHLQRIFLGCA